MVKQNKGTTINGVKIPAKYNTWYWRLIVRIFTRIFFSRGSK